MKKAAFTMLFALSCYLLQSQSELRIELFGNEFNVLEYNSLNRPCQVYGSCVPDNDLIEFFIEYFESASFESYRALYLDDDWFGATKSDYDKWQDYIKKHPLIADAYYIVNVAGYRLGIVAHYLRLENQVQRKNFIAKNVNGKWMPTGGKLSDELKTGITMLSLIKTDYIERVKDNPDLIDQFVRAEPTQKRSDDFIAFHSPVLYDKERRSAQIAEEENLKAFLTELDVSAKVQDEAIEMIRTYRYLDAVRLIDASQDSLVAINVAKKINEIYGEDLITLGKE